MPASDTLTMGQIARLCRVSPRTAAKWFDSGRLSGYRIPGGRDRRVTRADLVAFMAASGFPPEFVDEASGRANPTD